MDVLHDAALQHSAGRLFTEDLSEVAVEALGRGVDSPSLRELAGAWTGALTPSASVTCTKPPSRNWASTPPAPRTPYGNFSVNWPKRWSQDQYRPSKPPAAPLRARPG